MKRRAFGVLAGANFVAAGTAQAAVAKPLGAGLTPMGAEQAGNADGSIPAWTGGLSAPALAADRSVDVRLFEDEKPLFTVDARNMAKYAALLTPGTQAMVRKFGFRVGVYQTHRTAAAPQDVYDNTARNAAGAKLEAKGGQFGFTGAFGGVPFPVIETADAAAGGSQLIWNHLTAWQGRSGYTGFAPIFVVADGGLALSSAAMTKFEHPYYDPDGSVISHESGLNFDGYFSKTHLYYKMPPSVLGMENLIWRSTNLNTNPDIIWSLLPGQGRLRKDRDGSSYGEYNPAAAKIANLDEYSCFFGAPAQYDWRYIGKQEMLVPYNCNAMHFCTAQDLLGPKHPNPEIVRWEKHRVWVAEASLRAGEKNDVARRRLYIDEDSWSALLGEGYDAGGALVKYYTVYNRCVPSIPAMRQQGSLVFDLRSGDYVYAGGVKYETYVPDEFMGPLNEVVFEPPEMAAVASF